MTETVNAPLPRRRHGPSGAGVKMVRPHYRMSASMVEAVREFAASLGLTAPAWLRGVVAERLDMTDSADLQPVRAYGGGSPDARALTALRMQLHQLGGLLVQMAKVSRQGGSIALHADAERTLAEVRAAIHTVAAWQESNP